MIWNQSFTRHGLAPCSVLFLRSVIETAAGATILFMHTRRCCRCPSAFVTPAVQIEARQLVADGTRKHQQAEYGYYDTHSAPGYNEKDTDWVAEQRLAASTCPWDKVSFDINGPWVSGNVGGTLIVRRTLTAVCGRKGGPVRFKAVTRTAVDSDFSIKVWPQSVWLVDGESATVTITVKAHATTPLDTYQFGEVGCSATRGCPACREICQWSILQDASGDDSMLLTCQDSACSIALLLELHRLPGYRLPSVLSTRLLVHHTTWHDACLSRQHRCHRGGLHPSRALPAA